MKPEIGKIIKGNEVLGLPWSNLWHHANKVSLKLKEHPTTMLQNPPTLLMQSMLEGRVVMGFDKKGNLAAFGHIWYEGPSNSIYKTGRYEFGSWICFKKGMGKKVLEAAIELAAQKYPNADLVAKVACRNIRAQMKVEEAGGAKFAYEYSPHIKTKNGERQLMFCYYITKSTGLPNRPIFGGRNG